MASSNYYFSGIAEWAKVKEPDKKFNNYTLDLYLDKKSLALFKDSGLQLTLREGKDGEFVKFKRPVTKQFKGELVKLDPPVVLLRQPTADDPDNYVPFDGLIGNGSQVTIKVLVYDTMKGKGHQIEVVAVDTLVPYGEVENITPDGMDLPF